MPTPVLQALGRAGLFCWLHPGTSHYIQKQLCLLGTFPTHSYLGRKCSPLLEPTVEVLQHSVEDHRKKHPDSYLCMGTLTISST